VVGSWLDGASQARIGELGSSPLSYICSTDKEYKKQGQYFDSIHNFSLVEILQCILVNEEMRTSFSR
jgi:hypothetical protein